MHSGKHSWMWMQCERRNGIVNMDVRCPGTQSPYLPSTPCRVFASKDTKNALVVVKRLQISAMLESQANCTALALAYAGLFGFIIIIKNMHILNNWKNKSQLKLNNLWNYFPMRKYACFEKLNWACEAIAQNIVSLKNLNAYGLGKKRVWRKNFDYATVTAQSTDNLYSN